LPDDFDYENSTIHAVLEIGGATVYMSDSMRESAGWSGKVKITLELDTKDQLDAIWVKVKANNFNVVMELQKTFWGAFFAQFEDADGVGWQLNYTEAPSAESVPSPKPAAKKGGKKAKKAARKN